MGPGAPAWGWGVLVEMQAAGSLKTRGSRAPEESSLLAGGA